MKCAIGFVLFAFACSPATPPAPPVPSETSTTTSYPAPAPDSTAPATTTTAAPPARPATETRNITIETVEMGNPLVIAGRARTFENNVVLRARAADGAVIADGFTTATGEMGQHSPYRGSLWLTREPGSRIVVEALEYSAKDGSETNLVRVEKAFTIPSVEGALYFPDEGCKGVKPYTRRMPKTVSMARLLAEALVKGPTASERKAGAAFAFPEHSGVQSVILRDATLTVDFNERLQNVGGSCRAQMIRESVTRTMLKLPSVKKVVITAGGSEALALQP